jgi:hypothetical protein
MKKLHKILIVVAVALAGAIAGTVVMTDTVGESNVAVQAVRELDKPVAENRVVDDTASQSNSIESVDVDIDVNLPDFTKEELEAMYPGYLEWFTAKHSQALDNRLGLPDFTKEELVAMYPAPGFLEWFTAKQAQSIDASPRLPEFTKEELEAMYPGYLEWWEESQVQK